MTPKEKIRNIAIIAHIDHGKTTLLDALLVQSGLFRDNEAVQERMMDSYDQEKERGITIFSKNTTIAYKDFKVNVIDTPGHADFSGEVERCLGMVDSVLLLVDAKEGPMPQTRFVLSKSLQMGIRPIVVLNKIDKPGADPERVLDETFDLFTQLGATDDQLDFPFCYASGLSGYAIAEIDNEPKDMSPLLDLIVEKVSPPPGDPDKSLLMQISTLGYDDFLGRLACGRILNGKIRKGQTVEYVNAQGKKTTFALTKLQGYQGLKKIEIDEAGTGDVILLAGAPEILIGDTVREVGSQECLPPIAIEEPTVSIEMSVNTSPFAGREGKHVTMNKIRDRLEKEKKANITLRIEEVQGKQDVLKVSGRGELHLAVLIEAMRREDFEMSLSKPKVITKLEEGVTLEPMEKVLIQVPEEYSGLIIEDLAKRKGEMLSLHTDEHNITTLEYLMPMRGLIGYRNTFLTKTRGLGILTSIFDSFKPWKGEIPSRITGAAISLTPGKANGYACFNLQERMILFVEPGDDVYEGMVVGENSRDNDLVVNVTKGKQLTNVRASGNDENIMLTPPRRFTLEQAIDFIQDDELVEVTPKSIRLRKIYLSESDRKRKKK